MKKLFILFLLTFSIFICQSQTPVQFGTQNSTVSYTKIPNECTVVFTESSDSVLLNSVSYITTRLSNSTYIVGCPMDSLIGAFGPNTLIFPSLKDASGQSYYVSNEIVLSFNTDISMESIAAVEDSLDLLLLEYSPYFRQYKCNNPIAASQFLCNSGLVQFCEPNYFFQPQLTSHIPNDPYFTKQFYLQNTGQELNDGLIGIPFQDIKIIDAWSLTTGHNDVKIAIVDAGGIELNHPDLPEYKIERIPLFTNSLSNVASSLSTYAHAQACAGIIGAEMDNEEGVTGICPRSKLIPLGFGPSDFVKSTDIANIVYWLTDANNAEGAKIASVSLIPPSTLIFYNAVEAGIQTGVVFCFAAGNTAQHILGCDGAASYPNVYLLDNVLVVGASTARGNAADYSAFGNWVDIAAPSASDNACPSIGCEGQASSPVFASNELPNIWTTDVMGATGFNSNFSGASSSCIASELSNLPQENNNYTGRFYGTSAATPQVAAVIGLMRAANSCLTIGEITEILRNTSDQTGVDIDGIPYNYYHDLDRPGHSVELGYGRLDAYEAVSQALLYGDFDFEINVIDPICGLNDNGTIQVHFPSENASEFQLFVEWPAYSEFEELPSLEVPAEESITIPNQGNRPYLLHVIHTNSGCNSTRQFWIYQESPIEITTIENVDCFPVRVCAEAIGGTEPYSYHWNNQTSEACSEFTEDYLAQVTVYDDMGCSTSADVSIEVDNYFQFSDEIIFSSDCFFIPNSAINFTNFSNVPNAIFEWSFGDGSTSFGQSIAHSFSSQGNYLISLSITKPGCEPVIISESIEIGNFDFPNDLIISNQTDAGLLLLNNSSYGGSIIFSAAPDPYIINDLTLYLNQESAIVIQEGATVTFNNCNFTSCGYWQGFDVKSNSITPVTAGRLSFDPSGNSISTIEFAQIGIESFDEKSNANTVSISTLQAGYLTCNRTRFKNNPVSVLLRNARMQIYTPNAGFNRCSFTVNDEMKKHFLDEEGDYNVFLYHVSANRMQGYHFKGCSFKNEMTSETPFGQWKNRGIGVYSQSSRFFIDKATSTQVGVQYLGTFEGLDRGISTGKGVSNLRISNQSFKKNHVGIYLGGAAYCRVYSNTFRIGEITGLSELDNQLTYGTFPGNSLGLENGNGLCYEGLVIQKGDFHEVAENTFIGYRNLDGGVNDDYAKIGVRVRATNTEEMVVRKNNFSRLSFANLANGDNAGGTSTSGLRFICNTNSQNTQDFTNTDFLGTQSAATIASVQYEPISSFPISIQPTDWPAGNTFSIDNPSTATHFRNEGVSIQSYWFTNLVNQIPTDIIGIGNLNQQSSLHTCPSLYTSTHINTPHSLIGLKIAEGNVSRLEAEEYRYLYLLLVDDGDTEALKFFVENTWGSQVWSTRESLLQISPFVSEEVMYKVLDETITFPHAMAFEIISANPELLRNPKFVSYLFEKSDPMPEYLIDLLMDFSQQSTEKSDLEANMAEKRTQHISKISEALWGMMDYEDDSYLSDDFRAVLSQMKVLNSELFVISDLIDEGNLDSAIVRLENIPQVIPLGREEKREYEAFIDWVNWRKLIILSGRDINNLTLEERDELENIAQEFDSFAALQALAILNEEEGSNIFTPPALGKLSSNYKSRVLSTFDRVNASVLMNILPNPANYWTQINLTTKTDLNGTYALQIMDISGRIIHEESKSDDSYFWLLNTSNWSSGIYTVRIISTNGNQLTEKLHVAH